MPGDDNSQPVRWMNEAVRLARDGVKRGDGGPFGAVIIREGVIVGRGWNRVLGTHDPTAHAEVVAIRDACSSLRRVHLEDCEIFSSCEPCPMCLAAIYWARIPVLWFANSRDDAERIGFSDAELYRQVALPPENRSLHCRHLPDHRALKLFADFAADPHRKMY